MPLGKESNASTKDLGERDSLSISFGGISSANPRESSPGFRSSPASRSIGSILIASKQWWSISRKWFVSEEQRRARLYAVSAILISVVTTALLLRISDVQASFSSALVRDSA